MSLDPAAQVVFTKHADKRLRERSMLEIDQARQEILEAVLSRRFEWRARNIWYVWTRHRERLYSLAAARGLLVVLTVLSAAPPEPIPGR